MKVSKSEIVAIDIAVALLMAATFYWLFGQYAAYAYIGVFVTTRAWKGYGLMFVAFELSGILKTNGGAK